MNLRSNTVFITGGASGIGLGLAQAFYRLRNKVIIGSRRQDLLKQVCSAHEGMDYVVVDVGNPDQIQDVAGYLIEKYPSINRVINNAGIQRLIDFTSDNVSNELIEEEIGTNFTGLVQICAAFLPHLRKQNPASLINVSSGLGLTPLSKVPVYSATKAAVHSFTKSLRHQLKGTSVEVIELIPPSVATELRSGRNDSEHVGPPAMPLDEYISQTMTALETNEQEIAVGSARFGLRATSNEEVSKIFSLMNP
jgi:uncharacterized oxidoreductase